MYAREATYRQSVSRGIRSVLLTYFTRCKDPECAVVEGVNGHLHHEAHSNGPVHHRAAALAARDGRTAISQRPDGLAEDGLPVRSLCAHRA